MQLGINIDVPDLHGAVEFYRKAFALRHARTLFEGSVAEMTGAPVSIYLLQKETGTPWKPGAPDGRHYARHWTPVHLDFVVDDLETALGRALAAGAKSEGGIVAFAWGRQAVMSDPFGNGVCLVQWVGRGYGEVED